MGKKTITKGPAKGLNLFLIHKKRQGKSALNELLASTSLITRQVTEINFEKSIGNIPNSAKPDIVLVDDKNLEYYEELPLRKWNCPVIVLTGDYPQNPQPSIEYLLMAHTSPYLLEKTIESQLKIHSLNQKNEGVELRLDFLAHSMQSVQDAIVITDLEGKITFWNKGAEKMTGLDFNQVKGSNIKKYYPAIFEEVVKNYSEIIEGRELVFDDSINNKEYEKIYINLRISSIRGNNGPAIGFISVARDISEIKKAQKTMEQEHQGFELLFQNYPDAVFIMNLEGDLLSYNDKTASLLGISQKGETINFKPYVAKEDLEKTLRHFQLACQGQIQQFTAHSNLNPKNNVFSVSYIPIFQDEKVVAVYGIGKDITDNKRAVSDLECKKEELNAFIYRVSHDLRGPLSTMMGLCNLARIENANHENYLGFIETLAKRLDGILQNFLKISTVNQGEANPRLFVFNNLVDEIVSSFVLGPNTKITKDFETGAMLFSDEQILSSILQNVIENALKYRNKHKSLEVKVSMRQMPEGFKISVSDNGVGIPKNLQEKVFNMFFRATEFSSGSGLGLYIVKNFCERLNGEISLESEEGVGTTVSFTFTNYSSLQKPVARFSDQ